MVLVTPKMLNTELNPTGLSDLRVGLLGGGFMGQVHARAIRAAGAQLALVASSSPESTMSAAERFGRVRGVRPEELLASQEIDVVHVCTPNALHALQAEAALVAGKHVICEKPLATSAAEATRLQAVAARTGKVNAVPFIYRYYPTVRHARALMADGSGDSVRLIHGSYLQDWVLSAGEDNWRLTPELGGPSGAFADIGIHWCDLIEFVSGHRIVAVHAQVQARGGLSKLESAVTVMFRTDRGALGSLVVSQVTQGRKNRLWFSIDAADASLSFDQEIPEQLWVGGPDGSSSLARGAGTTAADAVRFNSLPAGHPQGYQDCFNAFVADVYASIEGGTPAPGLPTFEDGHRGVRITEAVLRSATTGLWVNVADGSDASTPAPAVHRIAGASITTS